MDLGNTYFKLILHSNTCTLFFCLAVAVECLVSTNGHFIVYDVDI